MKLEIGLTVNSTKLGSGIITKIITKSTGYVEVNYNGKLKKEMAFNLTDENGISLKSEPKINAIRRETKFAEKMQVTSSRPAMWINSDGTTNYNILNDFLAEREKAAWSSKSF
jgi:hypothetical protein